MATKDVNEDGTPIEPGNEPVKSEFDLDDSVPADGTPPEPGADEPPANKPPEKDDLPPEGYVRGADGLLYNDEYPEARFKGVFSAWQKDHQALVQKDNTPAPVKPIETPAADNTKVAEDKWFDFIYGKIKDRDSAERKKEDDAAASELSRVSVAYPALEQEVILKTAIKYKTEIATAAEILADINSGAAVKEGITKDAFAKKKAASKIAAEPGAQVPQTLTPYDPKLTMAENIDKGVKELGT